MHGSLQTHSANTVPFKVTLTIVDVGGSGVRKGDVLTKTIAQDSYINMSLHPTRCNVGQLVDLTTVDIPAICKKKPERICSYKND